MSISFLQVDWETAGRADALGGLRGVGDLSGFHETFRRLEPEVAERAPDVAEREPDAAEREPDAANILIYLYI